MEPAADSTDEEKEKEREEEEDLLVSRATVEASDEIEDEGAAD